MLKNLRDAEKRLKIFSPRGDCYIQKPSFSLLFTSSQGQRYIICKLRNFGSRTIKEKKEKYKEGALQNGSRNQIAVPALRERKVTKVNSQKFGDICFFVVFYASEIG